MQVNRMTTGDDIRSQILALPAVERASLAKQLLLSLDQDSCDEDAGQLWGDEAQRRSIAYQHGQTTSRDWRESVREMREALKPRREK